jgi:hypothetical protein
MENGKQGAFASMNEFERQEGLTKLEYFAGLAMQEVFRYVLENQLADDLFKTAAVDAVKMAYALLEELEKTNRKKND